MMKLFFAVGKMLAQPLVVAKANLETLHKAVIAMAKTVEAALIKIRPENGPHITLNKGCLTEVESVELEMAIRGLEQNRKYQHLVASFASRMLQDAQVLHEKHEIFARKVRNHEYFDRDTVEGDLRKRASDLLQLRKLVETAGSKIDKRLKCIGVFVLIAASIIALSGLIAVGMRSTPVARLLCGRTYRHYTKHYREGIVIDILKNVDDAYAIKNQRLLEARKRRKAAEAKAEGKPKIRYVPRNLFMRLPTETSDYHTEVNVKDREDEDVVVDQYFMLLTSTPKANLILSGKFGCGAEYMAPHLFLKLYDKFQLTKTKFPFPVFISHKNQKYLRETPSVDAFVKEYVRVRVRLLGGVESRPQDRIEYICDREMNEVLFYFIVDGTVKKPTELIDIIKSYSHSYSLVIATTHENLRKWHCADFLEPVMIVQTRRFEKHRLKDMIEDRLKTHFHGKLTEFLKKTRGITEPRTDEVEQGILKRFVALTAENEVASDLCLSSWYLVAGYVDGLAELLEENREVLRQADEMGKLPEKLCEIAENRVDELMIHACDWFNYRDQPKAYVRQVTNWLNNGEQWVGEKLASSDVERIMRKTLALVIERRSGRQGDYPSGVVFSDEDFSEIVRQDIGVKSLFFRDNGSPKQCLVVLREKIVGSPMFAELGATEERRWALFNSGFADVARSTETGMEERKSER